VTNLETTFYVDDGDGPSPVTVALGGPEREEANQHACTFTVSEGEGSPLVRTGHGADGWQAEMIALNMLIQEVEMRYGSQEVYWRDPSGDEEVEPTELSAIFGGLTRVERRTP
jgi:hypothetical protein